MQYLVDGHNLIPKIPGLSLAAEDDEIQLIRLLQEFCRKRRSHVEVYFDRAAPGGAGAHPYGRVTAHFVASNRTADAAIRSRLDRMGRSAGNWTVVSSDTAVQNSARLYRASWISSEDFSRLIGHALSEKPTQQGERPASLDEAEVNEWLRLFRAGRDEKE